MNIKRALWIGALTYMITFIIGVTIAFIVGVDVWLGEELNTPFWLLSIFLTVVIVVFFANWYFQDKKIKRNVKEGLIFALVLFLVAAVFDLILAIPFILANGLGIFVYYLDPFVWISVLVMFATAAFVGWYKK